MANIFRSRRPADGRSGGKIVRGRRIAAAKTPYDRPPPPAPPQNPYWLSGLIFPATRMIASGAGKLISSVFGPDTSSSSSSSDSEYNESGSEDEASDKNDDLIPSDGVDRLKKVGTSSETTNWFRKEPHLTVGRSETKRIIERLLLQETFSREECDRLINIINSRVVDNSTAKGREDGRLHETSFRTAGADIPDICSKAVMEAKKWLEKKKVGSSSNSHLDHGTCTFNSTELPHAAGGSDAGSPVDVAKSYMQARPPWSSPSVNHVNWKTPSPVGIELFKEETPFSIGGISSSKKRDSLATGSWNILEEIRRVRSRATEEMLQTLPTARIDLSSYASEPNTAQNIAVADKTEVGMGNKVHDLNSLTAMETIDASVKLASGVSSSQVFQALVTTQDGSQNEVLPSKPGAFVSEQNQDFDAAIQIVEGGTGAASKQYTDSRSSDRNCLTVKEVTESGAPIANGFPPSGSGLSTGMDAGYKPDPSHVENPIPMSSSHDKLNNSTHPEETCELLSEASIEVPVVNETNSIASGSENTSSPRHEELSMELTEQTPKHSLAAKTSDTVEKQRGRKMGRYNRRGRGRGK